MAKMPLSSDKVDDLPGWIIEVDEVSAGVYKITATDTFGRSVAKVGCDPDSLLADCKKEALLLAGTTAR
jgi:hypothetical protein